MPGKNRRLHFERRDQTINEFLTLKLKGKLITNPEYQRDFVYNQTQSSRLIESALLSIPIPTIYLCDEQDGKISIIDGQQRIVSFLNFVSGQYALKGLSVRKDLNGLYYKDLEDEDQGRIDRTSITTITLDQDSSDVKYEIFERLNRGAVSLREQELRNCVYRGSYNSMINDLAENKNVKVMFKSKNNRMSFQENILRFFALRNFSVYKPSMKSFLNNYMKNHQFDDEISVELDKKKFEKTLITVKEILGDNAFSTVDYEKGLILNKFSPTFYDSIMVAFSIFDREKLKARADIIRNAIEYKKLHDDKYHNACYAATGSKDRVIQRILTIFNFLKSELGDNGMKEEIRVFPSDYKKLLAEKQNYVCPICRQKILNIDDCEIDHIIPYSLGGKTEFENAQLVHMTCNRAKGNKVDSNKIFENISKDNMYKLSDITDATHKKITMYSFREHNHAVHKFYNFFTSFICELNDLNPMKFKELADENFTISSRAKAYVSHTNEGMVKPYEINSGVYVECCFDNNRMMSFVRALCEKFNVNLSEVVLYFKEKESDE